MAGKTIKEILENENLIVLDLETTGLDKRTDEILQIGVIIVVKNKIKARLSYYINPNMTDEQWVKAEQAASIHGLTREFIEKNGLNIKDVIAEIESFIKLFAGYRGIGLNTYLVGQNCTVFDIPFVEEMLKRKEISAYHLHHHIDTSIKYNTILDTKFIATNLKTIKSNSLKDLAEQFGIVNKKAHDALSDCETTLSLLRIFADLPDTKDVYPLNSRAPYTNITEENWKTKIASMQKYFGQTLGTIFFNDNKYFNKFIAPLIGNQ